MNESCLESKTLNSSIVAEYNIEYMRMIYVDCVTSDHYICKYLFYQIKGCM